jgi:hypothetical protein
MKFGMLTLPEPFLTNFNPVQFFTFPSHLLTGIQILSFPGAAKRIFVFVSGLHIGDACSAGDPTNLTILARRILNHELRRYITSSVYH